VQFPWCRVLKRPPLLSRDRHCAETVSGSAPSSPPPATTPPKACPIPPRRLRGKDVYDGAWGGNGEGFLPCPPNVTHCIRLSAFPPGLSLSDFFREQILPATAGELNYLRTAIMNSVQNGNVTNRTAATVEYLSTHGGKPLAGAGLAILARGLRKLSELKTPGEGEADIWPGRRHKMPTGAVEWIALQIAPKVGRAGEEGRVRVVVAEGTGSRGALGRVCLWGWGHQSNHRRPHLCRTAVRLTKPSLIEAIASRPTPKRQGPEMSHSMFELGRAEALSWAQEQGFPAALAKQSLAPYPVGK
jgi:hypothetical protein